MRTLHIYCDFWEPSVSRALHETRVCSRHRLHIEHIYSENLLEKLKLLVEGIREGDHALIIMLHAGTALLAKAGKLLTTQSVTLREQITVSFSKYSPEVRTWAKGVGIKYEENKYEMARYSPWEPYDPKHGTTLSERRWIQYRLMKVLIAGESPAAIYEEIFKKLRSNHLPESEVVRAQAFYERNEPDMAGGNFHDVRNENPNSIDRLRDRAVQVGRSGLNTLIIGETGTGKESLAWYLHDYSTRYNRPFVALNCAFFEGERLESELFGHEQGSFTDAKRMKKGLVEDANNGTLFLDELPEMAPRVQAKLLRFLQDGTYTRLGGTTLMRANVRVISAAQANRIGTLREDLYYRLADVELHTVPLREMTQRDIANIACNLAYRLMWRPIITEKGQNILTPDLIREIWQRISSPENAASLSEYNWPGNMRELSAMVKRLVLLDDDIFSEIHGASKASVANEFNFNDDWQRFISPISNLDDLKNHQINLKELQPAFVRHVVTCLGGRDKLQPTKLAEALGCTYNTLMSCLKTNTQ